MFKIGKNNISPIITQRVAPSQLDKTTALFCPSKSLSGAMQMDRILSFDTGDSNVEPVLCVRADGSGGQVAEYGSIELAGSGTAPSNGIAPFGLDGSYSTRYAVDAQYHQALNLADYEVGLNSAFMNIALRVPNIGVADGVIFGAFYTGLYLWMSPTTGLGVFFRDSSSWKSYYIGTEYSNTYILLSVAAYRSGSMRIWVNGVAVSQLDITTVSGNVVNTSKFGIGNTDYGSSSYGPGCDIQYGAFYIVDDIGTHLQDSLADRLYSQWSGQYLAKAKGIQVPTTLATRTDEIFLRKRVDGEDFLVQASKNVPPIEHDENGVAKYSPNISEVNRVLDNFDLSTSNWTKAGTVTVSSDTGPHGLSCACKVSGLGGSGNTLYQQVSGYSGGADMTMVAMVKFSALSTGTLTYKNDYSGWGAAGELSIDITQLNDGKWHLITPFHSAVTIVAAGKSSTFPSGQVEPCLSSSSSLSDFWFIGLSIVEGTYEMKRPILTTSAARTTAACTVPLWDDSTNIPVEGTVTYNCSGGLTYDGTYSSVLSLSDGTSANRYLVYVDASDLLQLHCAGGSGSGQVNLVKPSNLEGVKMIFQYGIVNGFRGRFSSGSFTSYVDNDPVNISEFAPASGAGGSYPILRGDVYEVRIEDK